MFRILFIKVKLGKKLYLKSPFQFFGKNIDLSVSGNSLIKLDHKNYFSKNATIGAHDGGKITIGKNNFFNNGLNIESLLSIEIGNDNLFGPNVSIFDHSHSYTEAHGLKINETGYRKKRIFIGSDVWIATGCVICEGVVIEDHVVVGANSVVTGNLESGYFYAGAPAKKIKGI